MLDIENAKVGEDVIVIKNHPEAGNKLCEIWKVKKRDDGTARVSVSDDGQIYNFELHELVLA